MDLGSSRKYTRGFALLASMLLAMSVLMMVTIMLKTSKSEFEATKLNGEQMARYYVAKAACAEMVVMMGESSDWGVHLNGEPLVLEHYDPPVTITLQSNVEHFHLIQVKADCLGETAIRVVRNRAEGEALLFTVGESSGARRFYRTARREGRTPGGGGDSSWRPMAPPPAVVFDSTGTLVPFSGDTSSNYAADFKGHFYSALSDSDGFAVYSYAGSGGWERLPGRPAVGFTITGATTLSSNYLGTSGQPLLFDASKDGTALLFVENVEPQTGMAEGSAYLQKYDFENQAWSVQELPRDYTLSPDGHYQIEEIAAGSDGRTYLRTKATASQPSRILALDGDGNGSLLPTPNRKFYAPTGNLIDESGALEMESLAVDPDNNLLISSPTEFADWYAVSKYDQSGPGWRMGLDTADTMTPLRHRNYASQPGFEGLTVDSSNYVVVGDQAQSDQGNVDIGFSEVDDLPDGVTSDRSKIGGGLAAQRQAGYLTTAEY